jgi:hypothetical protein
MYSLKKVLHRFTAFKMADVLMKDNYVCKLRQWPKMVIMTSVPFLSPTAGCGSGNAGFHRRPLSRDSEKSRPNITCNGRTQN